MTLLRRAIPFALSALSLGAAQVAMATPPSTGAFVTDAQNTWVQDRVGDRVGTVNMIMCIIGSMRGDAMVNQGAYVALIDEGKCQGRGDSSKSTSTNAGASNATNFMSAVVQATQASESDPLIIKAWMHEEQDNGGSPEKSTIYVYVEAFEGKSETYPNGRFRMYFCGEPDAMPGNCMFSGSLQSDETGLSFYQDESGGGGGGGGGGGSSTQLKLLNNPNLDTGSGKISGTEGGSPYDYTFTYDGSHFVRKEGSSANVCFDRRQSQGETSTWRYGTYDSSGERLDIDNPGFPVKYVNGDDSYYGFWSFWGLWLPDSAMAEIAQGNGTLTRRVGSSDVALTPISKGGKLWRLTRNTSTLDELKNVSMMYWSHAAIGTTDGSTPAPTDTNYEVQWDGSALNVVGYQQCDNNGCTPNPLHASVPLSAATLRAAYTNALPVFFPSGGGNGAIVVPASGAFGADTEVSYRTREVVDPSGSDIGLNCVSMCPKTGTNLVSSGNLNGSPFKDGGVWGPSSTNYAYTFQAGMVNDGSADADASGATKSGMGGNQWGLTSGFMVADADLDSIRCNSNGVANTGGDHYCSSLADQLTTIYQWETGPNQWNKYFGASGVSISPPKTLSLDAVATFTSGNPDNGNNIRGGSENQLTRYHGNKVQLQFSGFGELQGIPGGCVDPDTNEAVQCGQLQGGAMARWVPAFDIVDGSAVTDGSQNYYVKFLEREMRLSKVSCGVVSGSLSLSAASALTLPDATLVDVNPKTTLGSEPTPASTKPAVIDGIVQ